MSCSPQISVILQFRKMTSTREGLSSISSSLSAKFADGRAKEFLWGMFSFILQIELYYSFLDVAIYFLSS